MRFSCMGEMGGKGRTREAALKARWARASVGPRQAVFGVCVCVVGVWGLGVGDGSVNACLIRGVGG